MRILKVIVVLAAIRLLAAVIYSSRRTRHNIRHPLTAELERLYGDAERLQAAVRGRLESIRAVQTTLGQTIDRLKERVAGIQGQMEQTQAELAQKEQAVAGYLTLLEKNRGAILPDGQYVSPDVVRRQYDFERGQAEALRMKFMLLKQQRDNVERISFECQQRYEETTTTLVGPCAARCQLQKQLAHVELMLQVFTDGGLGESTSQMANDVRRLQGDIAAIQDQLDVYLRESPEILALEPARQDDLRLAH